MANDPSTYLLIFRETDLESYEAMSQEELRTALDRWNGWCDSLAAAGHLQSGHPLEDAGRVISGSGKTKPVDGPFAETKELIGGYFLLTADSLDDATSIAEQCPNLPYGMTVEVRPVAGACHLARSLGWETMREPAGA